MQCSEYLISLPLTSADLSGEGCWSVCKLTKRPSFSLNINFFITLYRFVKCYDEKSVNSVLVSFLIFKSVCDALPKCCNELASFRGKFHGKPSSNSSTQVANLRVQGAIQLRGYIDRHMYMDRRWYIDRHRYIDRYRYIYRYRYIDRHRYIDRYRYIDRHRNIDIGYIDRYRYIDRHRNIDIGYIDRHMYIAQLVMTSV